jgi:hypothetical protein
MKTGFEVLGTAFDVFDSDDESLYPPNPVVELRQMPIMGEMVEDYEPDDGVHRTFKNISFTFRCQTIADLDANMFNFRLERGDGTVIDVADPFVMQAMARGSTMPSVTRQTDNRFHVSRLRIDSSKVTPKKTGGPICVRVLYNTMVTEVKTKLFSIYNNAREKRKLLNAMGYSETEIARKTRRSSAVTVIPPETAYKTFQNHYGFVVCFADTNLRVYDGDLEVVFRNIIGSAIVISDNVIEISYGPWMNGGHSWQEGEAKLLLGDDVLFSFQWMGFRE